MKVKSLSPVRLLATRWTVAHQSPPPMGFSRQEYWSGLPFPSPRYLPDPGIEPRSPSLQPDALISEPAGKQRTANVRHACSLLLSDCKRIQQLDVVFVLDHSGSISVQDQESMINLTIHLVKKSDVGPDRVRFGALRYSDDPEVLFYLNKYSSRSAIIEHLRRRRDTAGRTYTAKALERANDLFTEQHGSRLKQNVKQMLIVITDGESHDRENLSDAASKLRTKGVIIHAVGVGAADQVELEMMAGDKNHTIHVSAFDKLKDIYLPLQDSMCNNAQEGKLCF